MIKTKEGPSEVEALKEKISALTEQKCCIHTRIIVTLFNKVELHDLELICSRFISGKNMIAGHFGFTMQLILHQLVQKMAFLYAADKAYGVIPSDLTGPSCVTAAINQAICKDSAQP